MQLDINKIQNAIRSMQKAVVDGHNAALKNEGGVEVLTLLLQGAFNADPKKEEEPNTPSEETTEETATE